MARVERTTELMRASERNEEGYSMEAFSPTTPSQNSRHPVALRPLHAFPRNLAHGIRRTAYLFRPIGRLELAAQRSAETDSCMERTKEVDGGGER